MAPSGAAEKNTPFVYPLATFFFILRAIWTSKMIYVLFKMVHNIFKIFRLRRANLVPKTTEGKRPVAVGFFSFPWTPVPTVTVNQNSSALAEVCS